MLRYFILSVGLLVAGNASGQTLKKYAVSNSGCSAYFFCDPVKFTHDKSPDSSDVYLGECSNDGISYGIICVKLKEKITNPEESEKMLISYLDYLKTSFGITGATGYGKGHRLKNKENTRGVIDYWTDKDNANYKVKGWTDGKYIAVLYVYASKELPETKANVFLESLLLPG